jgi:predicted outer membrane repeat protein
MKTVKENKIWAFLVVFTFLIFLEACYEFDFVSQPFSAECNSSFMVEISATTTAYYGNGSYYTLYFGVLSPWGWSVEDSIEFAYGDSTGTFIYSLLLSDEMEFHNPAPPGYCWWVYATVEPIEYVFGQTCLLSPVLNIDNQPGTYYLDYMLGDESGGLNYRRSNGHMITVGLPSTLVVTNCNSSGTGSLREAIAGIDYFGSITFDMDSSDTIFLNDQLTISKSLNIKGPEDARQVISGRNQNRIFFIDSCVQPVFSNLTIVHGYHPEGGGIYCNNTSLKLEDATIAECSAYTGGGIYGHNSDLNILNTSVYNNQSNHAGGGIFITDESSLAMQNLVFTGNTSGRGAAIYTQNSFMDINTSTFCLNVAVSEGGSVCSQNSVTSVVNSILWGDLPHEIALLFPELPNSISIAWSDIHYGKEGIQNNSNGQVFWLEGAMNVYPLFTFSGEHPFALHFGSPCIDAGNPDTASLNLTESDILGNLRLWDGNGDSEVRIDMGAYEFASVPVGMWDVRFWISDFGMWIYPNPCRDRTNIYFRLEKAARVNVSVFNNLGQVLDVPVEAFFSEGEHTVSWKPGELPEGIYFCRLQSGTQTATRKIILTK